MDISKNIVMQSHLADALIELSIDPELAAKRIRFVKRLINLNEERIEEDRLNELWQEVNPSE